MKIIDLDEERKELFCLCLEDWSEEARESRPPDLGVVGARIAWGGTAEHGQQS